MGYKKGHVKTKIENIDRIIHLRIRQNCIKLQQKCDTFGGKVLSFNEADDDDICILSTNDYNLNTRKRDCSSTDESYFLTPEVYHELYDAFEDETENFYD